MEIKHIKNNNNKDFYLLVDSDGKIIEPVYRFILFCARNGQSPNTYKNKCHHLKIFFEWLELIDKSYLEIVNQQTAKGVLEYLAEFKTYLKFGNTKSTVIPIDGFKQIREISSINQIMSAVTAFYDFLSMNNEVEFNVYKQIGSNSQSKGFLSEMQIKKEKKLKNILIEKPKDKTPKYFTREQYNLLYQSCSNIRDRIMIGLGFEGGLRISEILGLQLQDLDEIHKNKIKIVKRELDNPDAFVKYDSEGIVFIPDYLRDEIILYINHELLEIDTNYVFVNLYSSKNKNQYMRRDTVNDMLERVAKKAGIEDAHFHMLRHGAAVDMVITLTKQKVPTANIMVQIKDKLRHQNLNTTISTYAEFTLESKKEIMSKYYDNLNVEFSVDGLDLDDIAQIFIGDDDND